MEQFQINSVARSHALSLALPGGLCDCLTMQVAFTLRGLLSLFESCASSYLYRYDEAQGVLYQGILLFTHVFTYTYIDEAKPWLALAHSLLRGRLPQ